VALVRRRAMHCPGPFYRGHELHVPDR